ncbi:MAG: PepSY-like domain-containing protein [Balneolaceae bacterium]|nr:PepSY-like domain-containing protein [Balneolaceae bacterium]
MKIRHKIRRGYSYLVGSVLLAIFLGLLIGTAEAQKEKVEKSELPEEVVTAIEKDYLPCKDRITWYTTDKSGNIDYYIATARGENMNCESVYNSRGELIQARTVMTNIKLPSFVMQSVKDSYPGWNVNDTRMVFRDFTMDRKHFEVVIARDDDEKTIYFDGMGKEVSADEVRDRPFTEIKRGQVPGQVVNSIEADFLPCKDKIRWYSEESARSELYVIRSTGRNMNCEAVYDSRGNLLHSKTVMTNVKLPPAVMSVITRNYPGWTISEDKMVMRDFDEEQRYFEVSIVRDGETRKLYYDANGKLVDSKEVVG